MHSQLRVWAAVALLAVGLLLVFDRTQPSAHVLDHASRWWPVALIALGIGGIMRLALDRTAMRGPALLVAVGAVALVATADPLPPGADRLLWPLLMVIAGAALLIRFAVTPRSIDAGPVSRIVSVAESRHLRWPNAKVSLGSVVAVASGCVIDLRHSAPETESARLDITAIGSGVDVIVPEHWRVEVRNRPVLGRCRDALGAVSTDPAAPMLEVNGLAIISGIEVRRP